MQLTSFIGREKESEDVKILLARTQLMTLTGTGGCGKTRLALQMAADLVEQYAGWRVAGRAGGAIGGFPGRSGSGDRFRLLRGRQPHGPAQTTDIGGDPGLELPAAHPDGLQRLQESGE